MSRWRVAVVAFLVATPILAWAAVGSYYLWVMGWGFYAWWPLMAMAAAGYGLAIYWQKKRQLLKPPDFEVPPHWTARDKAAYAIVEAKAKDGEKEPADKFIEPAFYLETAQDLSRALAAHYRPGTEDPTDNLTLPEILAVVELASHDLGDMVDKHLPGGHLLTVRDFKRAKELQKWYERGTNAWWAVSALFNPVGTGMRFAASKVGISTPLRMLQQNLYIWFYAAFVQRLGNYLIDLNSGRLRVGATRYRELVEKMKAEQQRAESTLEKQAAGPFLPGEDDAVGAVTITIMGQVKAGKSSLVNALLGEQRARTGVVPTTEGVERYELLTPGVPTKLILNDTVGYAHSGPRGDQVKVTAEAARRSDLLFLVMHARNPGRQADLDMLNQLAAWFAARPELKPPPIIGVVTHIDLLSPAMEWSPPYDFAGGTRPKEVNVREALAAARGQLGEHLVSVVPVCASPGREYGIDAALLPAVAQFLDEVRGVAMLRVLKAEADRDRVKRVFHQLLATGKLFAEQVARSLAR